MLALLIYQGQRRAQVVAAVQMHHRRNASTVKQTGSAVLARALFTLTIL
jgi:hypothetical protein